MDWLASMRWCYACCGVSRSRPSPGSAACRSGNWSVGARGPSPGSRPGCASALHPETVTVTRTMRSMRFGSGLSSRSALMGSRAGSDRADTRGNAVGRMRSATPHIGHAGSSEPMPESELAGTATRDHEERARCSTTRLPEVAGGRANRIEYGGCRRITRSATLDWNRFPTPRWCW